MESTFRKQKNQGAGKSFLESKETNEYQLAQYRSIRCKYFVSHKQIVDGDNSKVYSQLD